MDGDAPKPAETVAPASRRRMTVGEASVPKLARGVMLLLANLGGILQVLVGVADGQTLEVERLKQLAIALGTGTALLFARDSNKTSEASGAALPKLTSRLKLPE